MTAGALWERLRGRCQRSLSSATWRRPVRLRNETALISFSFDDFPVSALQVGGAILRAHGAAGTFYASLGLMHREEPVGRICSHEDLADVLKQGHELGCHTFGHCDAWGTAARVFEASILENRCALKRIVPNAQFETLAYPINSPRPGTKRCAGRHFSACRGGGQTINVGTMDLNNLKGFFLEQSRDYPDAIRRMIDRNRQERGWLIFATHDVRPQPSRFGCTPEFFEDVVRWATGSGARVLPVARALAEAARPFRDGG
jgi:Polysaccharide deacetylase